MKISQTKQEKEDITLAAIARRYLARTAPEARAQSLPPFLFSALLAAATARLTSSSVAAGISPEIGVNFPDNQEKALI